MDLCTVTEVLDGKITGDRVIILGGGQAGLVTADFLAEKGREVAVLNRKRHFAEEMSSNDRFYLRERLKRESVHLFKQVNVKTFTDDGVVFTTAGNPVTLEGFDTVVVAEAMTPVRDAKPMLDRRKIDVHVIGDAKTPRTSCWPRARPRRSGGVCDPCPAILMVPGFRSQPFRLSYLFRGLPHSRVWVMLKPLSNHLPRHTDQTILKQLLPDGTQSIKTRVEKR
jgi:hypothetical protein